MMPRAVALMAALAGLPPGEAAAFMDLYRSSDKVAAAPLVEARHAPGQALGRQGELHPALSFIPALGAPLPDLPQASALGAVPPLDGLEARSDRMAGRAAAPDKAVCISAIRAAEERHGIPENLLLAIGLQEAGRNVEGELTIWPWSVNSHGQSRMFDSRAEAISFVEAERASGRHLIDIGCMQINLHWHPEAFAATQEGFDPHASADYAAHFLRQLHQESGDWMSAAGNYHSRTPRHHQAYRAGIERNLAVASARAHHFARLASSAGDVGQFAKMIIEAPSGMGQDPAIAILRQRGFTRRMAATPPGGPAPVAPGPVRTAPAERLTGHWWGDGGDSGSARSIYSSAMLEPVIPALADNGPRRGG